MSLSHVPFRMPALAAACAALAVSPLTATPAAAEPLPAPVGATTTGSQPLVSRAGLVATTSTPTSAQTAARSAALTRAAVMRTAASLKGRPYRWGASGPYAFDCSGYTKYVFARNGIRIPRTAQQQWRAVRKISRSPARHGDLVFFGGAYKYHVGIYAGNGKMWHSPHSGSSVRLVTIWSKYWSAGRVI